MVTIPEMVEEMTEQLLLSRAYCIKRFVYFRNVQYSKAADVMIVKNIAAEFSKNNRANSIAPGLIKLIYELMATQIYKNSFKINSNGKNWYSTGY